MRKFRTVVVASIAVATLALSACAGSASKDKEADDKKKEEVGAYEMKQAEDLPEGLIADIKKKGELVVGSKFDQPLIGQKDSATGEIEGFDAEIARLLAIRIFGPDGPEKNLKFTEATSENRETAVKDGSVDFVIASYSIYPDRIKNFDFAGPYLETGQNVMVAKDNKDIKSVDDLSGKKVCIAEGSGSIANLEKENPKAEIYNLKDYAACAQDLESGKADAVSTDSTILYGFTVDKKDAFKVLPESTIFTEENYGVAMKLGETDARTFVNDMITEATDNGDWQKAFDLTFGAAGMDEPKELPKVDNYKPQK